jgi:hypothetical protein
MTQLSIDGQTYELESLSEEARRQLVNLQLTDEEIRRLQVRLAIAQTARAAYASALNAELASYSKQS